MTRPAAPRLRRLAVVAALSLPLASMAACGDDLPASGRTRVGGDGVTLVYAPEPAPIGVGRHFMLELRVCRGDEPVSPDRLEVDAEMPAHRHGMNYAPTVRREGPGRYRAAGLMMHMPGAWRLWFTLSVDGRLMRLHHDLELR